ncbi:hypothetical protein [Ralstonia pseudosolanacearum]|uniref:hypothetical protein n=1 Tax=Ralstonia pseudosolanacearum TaxID=1310165 RepID=UPI003CE850AA
MTTIQISAVDAARLLPQKAEVHTFIRCMGWMGADVTREKALAAFKASVRVELSDEAAMFDHHLVVAMDGLRTFVETDQQALATLFPQFAGKPATAS